MMLGVVLFAITAHGATKSLSRTWGEWQVHVCACPTTPRQEVAMGRAGQVARVSHGRLFFQMFHLLCCCMCFLHLQSVSVRFVSYGRKCWKKYHRWWLQLSVGSSCLEHFEWTCSNLPSKSWWWNLWTWDTKVSEEVEKQQQIVQDLKASGDVSSWVCWLTQTRTMKVLWHQKDLEMWQRYFHPDWTLNFLPHYEHQEVKKHTSMICTI